MPGFDPEAYNAAYNLFKAALMVRRALPSLVRQISDSCDMLGMKPPDGMPRAKTNGNECIGIGWCKLVFEKASDANAGA